MHHKRYIRQIAEDMGEKLGQDPDSIKRQLLERERSKSDWLKIIFYLRGQQKGSLNKLIIPDPNNTCNRIEIYNKEDIEEALLEENKKIPASIWNSSPLASFITGHRP